MTRRLRVLFDAFELSPEGGKSIGIYNYAVNVWRALQAALPPEVELVLACHGRNQQDFPAVPSIDQRGASVSVRCLAPATPGPLARQWWLRFGAQSMARRERCAIYFSPKGFLPGWWGRTMGLRTCVVVHDLIPLWYAEHHPAQFSAAEVWLVNGGLVRACRHADQLITISQAAAADMQCRIPDMRPPKVVYNGLPPLPSTRQPPPMQGRPYIFAIASALPHKNAAALLDGYGRYRARTSQPLDLVVCGIDDPARQGVHAVKGLSTAELHGYYEGAALFVFLSLIEGFGFPPLEAMMNGTPSLCSDIPVLRETTMGNAFFVNPQDPDAIGAAMLSSLAAENQSAREAMHRRGPAVTGHYTWERCASLLADSILAIAR